MVSNQLFTNPMKATNICRFISLVSLTIGCSLAIMPPISAQEGVEDQDLSELRPLVQSGSILSLNGGSKLMDEAITAIEQRNYDVAEERLKEARQVLNQLSNFHLDIANTFQGIDNMVYNAERQAAVEAGQMRDQATYRLALVHRVQEKPELSVPLLIQVIRSQSPSTELGRNAYQQLFELGFVERPFGQ